jgi:hypothetical protein
MATGVLFLVPGGIAAAGGLAMSGGGSDSYNSGLMIGFKMLQSTFLSLLSLFMFLLTERTLAQPRLVSPSDCSSRVSWSTPSGRRGREVDLGSLSERPFLSLRLPFALFFLSARPAGRTFLVIVCFPSSFVDIFSL